MGYMRHHAIVVTSYRDELIVEARDKAIERGMAASEIVKSPINGYKSFLIAPDGSKEGWDDSDHGNEVRAKFIEWMDEQRFEDGSGPLDWVEVQYGDDDRETKVTAHDDEPRRHRIVGKLK